MDQMDQQTSRGELVILDRIHGKYLPNLGEVVGEVVCNQVSKLTKLFYAVLGSHTCQVKDLEELCSVVPHFVHHHGIDELSLALAVMEVAERYADHPCLVVQAFRGLNSTSPACLANANIRVGTLAFKVLEQHLTDCVVSKSALDLLNRALLPHGTLDLVCRVLEHNVAKLEDETDDYSHKSILPCVASSRSALTLIKKSFVNTRDFDKLVGLMVQLTKCCIAGPLGLLATCLDTLSNVALPCFQENKLDLVVKDMMENIIHLYIDGPYNLLVHACTVLGDWPNTCLGAMVIFRHVNSKAPLKLLTQALNLIDKQRPTTLAMKAVTCVMQRCVAMTKGLQDKRKDDQQDQQEQQEQQGYKEQQGRKEQEDQQDQQQQQEEQDKRQKVNIAMDAAMKVFRSLLVCDKSMGKVCHAGMELLLVVVRTSGTWCCQVVAHAGALVGPYIVEQLARQLKRRDNQKVMESLQDLLDLCQHVAGLDCLDDAVSVVSDVLEHYAMESKHVAELAMKVLGVLTQVSDDFPRILPRLVKHSERTLATVKRVAQASCDAKLLLHACNVVRNVGCPTKDTSDEASCAKRVRVETNM
jgi:hypothetical protein